MMQEQSNFLEILFIHLSKKMELPLTTFNIHKQNLQKNWYNSPEAIHQLTDQAAKAINIPYKLLLAIRKQLQQFDQRYKVVGKTSNLEENSKLSQAQKQKVFIVQTKTNTQSPQNIIYNVTSLSGKLLQSCGNNPKATCKILSTLNQIIHNIVQNVYEMKYRFLKFSNPRVIENICSHTCVSQFIESIGFQRQAQAWYMSEPKLQILSFYEECIKIQIQNIIGRTTAVILKERLQILQQAIKLNKKIMNQRRAINMQQIHQQQNLSEFNKYQMQNNFSQQRSNEQFMIQNEEIPIGIPISNNVSEYKQKSYRFNETNKERDEANVLQDLVKFRNQFLAIPLKNRKTRIYHKKKNSYLQARQTSLMKIIYQSKNEKYMKYSREDINFVRKKQLTMLLNQVVYKESCIKVQLPNEFIIQGWFGPCEKLINVLTWINEIIKGDTYLYVSPPKKIMKNELFQELWNLNCVPVGFFRLGIEGSWLIDKNYAQIIQK